MSDQHLLYFEDRKALLLPGRSYVAGRSQDSGIHLDDPGVSRSHARFTWKQGDFTLTDLDSTNGTFVNGKRIRKAVLREGDTIRMGSTVLRYDITQEGTEEDPGQTMIIENKLARLSRETDNQQIKEEVEEIKRIIRHDKERMARLAYRDELTGLHNRRSFDDKLVQEISRARRHIRPLGLLMIDVDHFKNLNDTYGHQKGDEVLKGLGAMIMEALRTEDFPARYGGEELTVILPESDESQSIAIAERIRKKIEKRSEQNFGVKVTVSVGVAPLKPDNPADKDREASLIAEDLIKQADSCLYNSKRSGRNRVSVTPGEQE